MFKKLLSVGLIIAVSVPAYAASNLDTLLGRIHSLKADFIQAMSGQSQMMQQSSGTLSIAEPNRFRWQVNSPNQQLFVSDGKQVWNDEQDLNQVTVTPLNTSLSATPLLLLSGRVKDVNEVFKVTALSHDRYRFTPKSGDELVQNIVLTFVGALPSELVVTNSLGQVTDIRFSHVELNPSLDPGLFEFTPGPDDDVLSNS